MRTVNESVGRKVKIGGAHGWVYPITPKDSRSAGGVATPFKYFKLYCKYSSLTGFKYLVEDETTWIERILWMAVYVIAVTSLFLVVQSGYREFIAVPISTLGDPDAFPTYKLDFPGVSICPINRISRASATKLATEIFDAGVSNFSVDKIVSLLENLGDLYESSFVPEDHQLELEEILKILHRDGLDLTGIMRRLAPQCSAFLLICMLHGERRNCSELFDFRKTQDGFCCTFNYIAEPDDIEVLGDPQEYKLQEVETVKTLGIGGGLTVVMDTELQDSLFGILPMAGMKVLISNPFDYPDATSGGLTEVLVPPLKERFIEIDAISFYSTENIRPYSTVKRGCIFPDETVTDSDRTSYSCSDCIVNCKATAMWERCRCRPFFLPRRGKDDYSQRTCSLMDIPCLGRNKFKWYNVLPHGEKANPLGTEILECQSCYPSCEDIRYTVSSYGSMIEQGEYSTTLLDGLDVDDECIVHIYFTNLGTVRLKQDVVHQWYELLSEIGSVCSIFLGFSLISVIELLYFAALLALELCGLGTSPPGTETRWETTPVQTIYWGELFPRSRLPVKTAQLNKKPMQRSTN